MGNCETCNHTEKQMQDQIDNQPVIHSQRQEFPSLKQSFHEEGSSLVYNKPINGLIKEEKEF